MGVAGGGEASGRFRRGWGGWVGRVAEGVAPLRARGRGLRATPGALAGAAAGRTVLGL